MREHASTIFTGSYCYRLLREGECWVLTYGGQSLRTFCPTACDLEFGDVLWGEEFTLSARGAAQRWLRHYEQRNRMSIQANGDSDLEYGTRLAEIMHPNSPYQHVFVLPGEPYPKPRPRFSKSGHAYSSKEQRQHEEDTAWMIKQHIAEPLDGNIAIACVFYRSTRRRVDYDNLVKHVLDSAQGIAFHNDDQITASLAIVEYDKHNPRTIIALCAHESSMVRTTRVA